MFVNGAYVKDLVSGSGAEVDVEIGSTKITIMANETGKAPKIYEIIVVREEV